jgi:prepilin-type N-terminal cleavage/methylation domain-containing protein
MDDMKNRKGFTLVEILAAMFIGLFLLGSIYVSMVSGQKSSLALENKITAHQDTRAVLEVMATEISMASYNSNFIPNIWLDPAGCKNPSPNQAYKGIQAADANSITVEMDTDNSGVVGDSSNEVITYLYDPANQQITRATNCGGAVSFLGDVIGNPRSERVVNNLLNMPIFTYFDGLGTPIPTGNLPASIPNIRRIQITLAVDTENVDPNTFQRRRMIYTTSLVPKNHATCQ